MIWIFYRMVGGFVGTGNTQLARLRWALSLAAYFAFASILHKEPMMQVLCVFLGVALMTFLGRLIPHSDYQNDPSIHDFVGMSIIGVIRLAMILLPYSVENWPVIFSYPIEVFHHPELILFDWHRLALCGLGVLEGVAYHFGWTQLDGVDSGIYYRNTIDQVAIRDVSLSPPVPAGETRYWLDQAAFEGGEWGELLTGIGVYQLCYVAILLIP